MKEVKRLRLEVEKRRGLYSGAAAVAKNHKSGLTKALKELDEFLMDVVDGQGHLF